MAEPNDQSKRPEDTDFKQQRLKAWQPILTPKWVIASFVILGIIFIPIGVVILNASNSVRELAIQYDNVDACRLAEKKNDDDIVGFGKECSVDMKINKNMDFPVYIYYQLSNFYQNHRRYVKSRSDAQLRGEDDPSTSGCDPLEKMKEDGVNKILYPCGLIAASYFSDQIYAQYLPEGDENQAIDLSTGFNATDDKTWVKNGIAWASDKKEKFKIAPYFNNNDFGDKFTRIGPEQKLINDELGREEVMIPVPEDEDLMVWMRTAGLPNFKKLYRIIKGPVGEDEITEFQEGDVIRFHIKNYFRVADFQGEKWIVASTTTWLGGKNSFLGYAYIIVGVLCVILALLFFLKHTISPRKLGDMRYFKWHADDNNRMRRNIG